MNSIIGTYDNFGKAMDAFKELKHAGYPVQNISITGLVQGATVNHGSLHINNTVAGTMIATALESVSEAAVFTVPELGYLFAAGGIIGTISKLNRADSFAGLSRILGFIGIDQDIVPGYTNNLEKGKFMVLAHGTSHDITIAAEILEKHITYSDAEGNHVSKFDLGNWIKNLNTDFPLGG